MSFLRTKIFLLFLLLPMLGQANPLLTELQAYLNTVRTAKGDFVQTVAGEGSSTGTFLLSRPWRMRLEYNPPKAMTLVADGRRYAYYDKELDELSFFALDALPFGFLLQDTINLKDPRLAVRVQSRNNEVALSVTRTDEETTPITFVLTRKPWALKYWTFIDAKGRQTTVRFKSLQTGLPLEKSLFTFKNPRFNKPL
jgi:outer membrane lipoprotein carrier protein